MLYIAHFSDQAGSRLELNLVTQVVDIVDCRGSFNSIQVHTESGEEKVIASYGFELKLD